MPETDTEEIVIIDSTERAWFQWNFHHHIRASLADTGNGYSPSESIQLHFPKTVLFPSSTLYLIHYTPSKFCNKWGTDNSFIPTASSILCTDSSILCPVEKIGRNHVIKGYIIMPSYQEAKQELPRQPDFSHFNRDWLVNVYIPLTSSALKKPQYKEHLKYHCEEPYLSHEEVSDTCTCIATIYCQSYGGNLSRERRRVGQYGEVKHTI